MGAFREKRCNDPCEPFAWAGAFEIVEAKYSSNRLFLQELMNAVRPIKDPGGIPGGLRWDVPGFQNGSAGKWELVVDVAKKEIVHFLFKSGK